MRVVYALVAITLALVLTGCPQQPPAEPPGPPDAGQTPAAGTGQPGDTSPTPDSPPPVEVITKPEEVPATAIPEVLLTDAQQATCLVGVGDTLPVAELPDAQGQSHPLAALLGARLSVVLFWSAGDSLYSQLAATGALEDLQKDVFEPFQDQGVAVVTINVGDSTEVVTQQATEAMATYPVLRDGDRAYFAQVATEKLPRVYVVDKAGKILWFDLEYSRTTHRKLLDAVEASLRLP